LASRGKKRSDWKNPRPRPKSKDSNIKEKKGGVGQGEKKWLKGASHKGGRTLWGLPKRKNRRKGPLKESGPGPKKLPPGGGGGGVQRIDKSKRKEKEKGKPEEKKEPLEVGASRGKKKRGLPVCWRTETGLKKKPGNEYAGRGKKGFSLKKKGKRTHKGGGRPSFKEDTKKKGPKKEKKKKDDFRIRGGGEGQGGAVAFFGEPLKRGECPAGKEKNHVSKKKGLLLAGGRKTSLIREVRVEHKKKENERMNDLVRGIYITHQNPHRLGEQRTPEGGGGGGQCTFSNVGRGAI